MVKFPQILPMSSEPPRPEQCTPDAAITPASKPQRVLACMLCQQRKVKCDRKFPCANCIKSRMQCVPAVLATRRRRRTKLPERELLDRIREYEELLQRNNIKFEPFYKKSVAENRYPGAHESDVDESEQGVADGASPSAAIKSERVYEPKNIWHAMNQGFRENSSDSDSSHDGVCEEVVKKALYQQFEDNNHLLFGSHTTTVELSTLHPEPALLFRLWQIYLDNVNPLLKVTHTPSLQGRIIEAASNVENTGSNLEALMFSIYCVAILTLTENDCQAIFGFPKEDLLRKYQFGCQQALFNCGFLRTDNRDCLTALFLYLVSIRPSVDPRALSSMLGIAVRIAQRLGIHNEQTSDKCSAFEAEMRRRLWWSLIIFDTRVGELAAYKTATLAPTWDCKIPLHVNDSDLRPDMKQPPTAQEQPTDAIFLVLRAELGEFVRHSTFHLDFTTPALKAVDKHRQHGATTSDRSDLNELEKMIEGKYLNFCDPENPLHFMTIWTTRGYLAKCRLVEYYSMYINPSIQKTDSQYDAVVDYAIRILECDTKVVGSAITKSFRWLADLYFPFPAYIHLTQDLRRRPFGKRADLAWKAMGENYEVRIDPITRDDSPLFAILTKIVIHAWESREAAHDPAEGPLVPPKIVKYVKRKVALLAQNPESAGHVQLDGLEDMDIGDLSTSMPELFGTHSLMYGFGGDDFARMQPALLPPDGGHGSLDLGINQWDWAAMNLR